MKKGRGEKGKFTNIAADAAEHRSEPSMSLSLQGESIYRRKRGGVDKGKEVLYYVGLVCKCGREELDLYVGSSMYIITSLVFSLVLFLKDDGIIDYQGGEILLVLGRSSFFSE